MDPIRFFEYLTTYTFCDAGSYTAFARSFWQESADPWRMDPLFRKRAGGEFDFCLSEYRYILDTDVLINGRIVDMERQFQRIRDFVGRFKGLDCLSAEERVINIAKPVYPRVDGIDDNSAHKFLKELVVQQNNAFEDVDGLDAQLAMMDHLVALAHDPLLVEAPPNTVFKFSFKPPELVLPVDKLSRGEPIFAEEFGIKDDVGVPDLSGVCSPLLYLRNSGAALSYGVPYFTGHFYGFQLDEKHTDMRWDRGVGPVAGLEGGVFNGLYRLHYRHAIQRARISRGLGLTGLENGLGKVWQYLLPAARWFIKYGKR
jgi:hypothetical protein